MNLEEKVKIKRGIKAEERKEQVNQLKESIAFLVEGIPFMSQKETEAAYKLLREKSDEYRIITGQYYQNWGCWAQGNWSK